MASECYEPTFPELAQCRLGLLGIDVGATCARSPKGVVMRWVPPNLPSGMHRICKRRKPTVAQIKVYRLFREYEDT